MKLQSIPSGALLDLFCYLQTAPQTTKTAVAAGWSRGRDRVAFRSFRLFSTLSWDKVCLRAEAAWLRNSKLFSGSLSFQPKNVG